MKLKKVLAAVLVGAMMLSTAGCTDSSAKVEKEAGAAAGEAAPAESKDAAPPEAAEKEAADKEAAPEGEGEAAALPTSTPAPEVANDLIGDGAGVTLKLTFAGEEFNKEKMNTVLKQYFDETGVSTEVIYVPSQGGWAGYFSKLQTMVAANDSPDLIRVAIEGFRIFQSGDLIVPINDLMEKYPESKAVIADMHPKLMEPFTVDGKIYGLTFDWNNVVTHFNTNILKERGLEMPPENWTYDDFLSYAKKMTYKDANGQQVYGVSVPDYYFAVSAWLFNNNASVLNEDWTKCTLNSPEAIEVIQKLHDLVWVEKVAPQPPIDAGSAFMNGQVAMHFAGRWPLRSYADSGFEAYDIQYVPTMKTNQVIFGSGIFPVMKASKHQDEAFQLAVKLSSESSQKTIMEGGAIPSSIKAMDDVISAAKLPLNGMIYRKSADIAKAVESPASYAEVQSAFDRYMSQVFADELTPEEAMNQCAAEIDGILLANQ